MLTPVDALTILLPTQAFLMAAVTVGLAVDAPHRGFVSKFRLPTLLIPVSSIIITLGVALGSVVAWGDTYFGGSVRPLDEFLIGAALAAAAFGQPLLTVVIALAMIES